MIIKAFAIFDVKSDSFSTPFFKSASGQAVRDFADLANDKNTTVGRHPEDFKLCEVGCFDDSTGVLVSTTGPLSLGFASDYVERAEPLKALKGA